MGSRWKCAKSEAGREPGETYLLQEILNPQGAVLSGGGIRHMRRNKNPGAFTASGFYLCYLVFCFSCGFFCPGHNRSIRQYNLMTIVINGAHAHKAGNVGTEGNKLK